MDWVETEGIALVYILDILALQLAFKRVGSSRSYGLLVRSSVRAMNDMLARRGVAFFIDIDPHENQDGGPG
jgi:hypothetical protein